MVRKFNSFLVRIFLHFTKTKNNYFMFESSIFIYDNSFYLYKYLSNFKKLHLFYIVYTHNQLLEAKHYGIKKSHVLFISSRINIHSFANLFYILRFKILLKKCKIFFISYRNFLKEYMLYLYKGQSIVNLRHGQFPIKNVYKYLEGLCFEDNRTIYLRIGTEESLKLLPEKYKKLNCSWIVSPMPRLDSLKEDKFHEFCRMININCDTYLHNKYVLLLTTIRHHVTGPYFETQFPFCIADNDFIQLNDYLTTNKIILIIKAHQGIHLSENEYKYKSGNIIFIEEKDLRANDLIIDHLYNYIDCLLTDYSTAIFDFLYCDKPIGFMIENKNNTPTCKNLSIPIDEYLCGPKIYNIKDMLLFFNNLILGIDDYSAARKKIFAKFNGKHLDSYSKEVANKFIDSKYLAH